jgi:hypothetical protein
MRGEGKFKDRTVISTGAHLLGLNVDVSGAGKSMNPERRHCQMNGPDRRRVSTGSKESDGTQ